MRHNSTSSHTAKTRAVVVVTKFWLYRTTHLEHISLSKTVLWIAGLLVGTSGCLCATGHHGQPDATCLKNWPFREKWIKAYLTMVLPYSTFRQTLPSKATQLYTIFSHTAKTLVGKGFITKWRDHRKSLQVAFV